MTLRCSSSSASFARIMMMTTFAALRAVHTKGFVVVTTTQQSFSRTISTTNSARTISSISKTTFLSTLAGESSSSSTTDGTKASLLEGNSNDDDNIDWTEIMEVASMAARAAGEVIKQHVGCCSSIKEECEIKFNPKDIVTQYDRQAQDAVYEIVRAKYPTHAFLGEENVEAGAAASEQALLDAIQAQQEASSSKVSDDFLWICDPIDGTANFASGLELCAVTMAVVYKGTPMVGVIYDPHRDELYSAVKGKGAFLNGCPIFTSSAAIDSVTEAIINAGCPADPNAFAASMRGVLALNGQSRGIRIIACSALTLAWIAAGRLTAHFGYDLSSWDLVAGALLIQEAGGTVTDLNGSDYQLTTRNMLCSCGGDSTVHTDILNILKEADAVSFTRST